MDQKIDLNTKNNKKKVGKKYSKEIHTRKHREIFSRILTVWIKTNLFCGWDWNSFSVVLKVCNKKMFQVFSSYNVTITGIQDKQRKKKELTILATIWGGKKPMYCVA